MRIVIDADLPHEILIKIPTKNTIFIGQFYKTIGYSKPPMDIMMCTAICDIAA